MIADIVRTFDLVTVVELCDDLTDLGRVLAVLGPRWSVVFSDYLRDVAGNRERIGFIHERGRVQFTGLASNAEADRRLAGGRYVEDVPWWRPPFMASFRRGRLAFVLLAAHVRWGARVAARRAELDALARYIVARTSERYFSEHDVIVAGDFNLSGAAPRALVSRGLVTAPGVSSAVTTDLAHNKRYDEIMCLARSTTRFTGRAGALDFYAGDHRPLFPHRRLTKQAFTFQLSDHLPLWTELVV